MLPLLDLTQEQARQLALISQGLHKIDAFGASVDGAYNAINHLSYIQIDSIAVIQRAHHHCLWSRVNNYRPEFIDQLVAQKKIFEYWSHAAAYLPMQDYRFSLPKKQAIAAGEKHWRDKNPIAEKRVLHRIQQEGPLRAQDFEPDATRKGAGWWDWKPDKVALEQLFIEGQLMVVERRGFQKVYDLTERVLPAKIDTTTPSVKEFEGYLINRYLRANGFATAQHISYLRKGLKSHITRTCQEMLESHELQQVTVGEKTYYALPGVTDLLKQAINPNQIHILSPFDNLVIQRKRLSEVFDFDYQIECYLPSAKRQYGYFSLPLLWGTEFVGRMDAKIDRKTQVLHIQHLHLETAEVNEFIQKLKPRLQAFMQFNGGKKIHAHQITDFQPLAKDLASPIKQQLQIL